MILFVRVSIVMADSFSAYVGGIFVFVCIGDFHSIGIFIIMHECFGNFLVNMQLLSIMEWRQYAIKFDV